MKNIFGIICFPGNKKDYEEWKGYECKVVGANANLFEECLYLDGKENPLKKGEAKKIEAIVNAELIPIRDGESHVWGLPITKKTKKS